MSHPADVFPPNLAPRFATSSIGNHPLQPSSAAVSPALNRLRVPSPLTFLWEFPFWASLLYGSIIPATKMLKGDLLGVLLRYADLFMLLSAIFYAAVATVRLFGAKRSVFPRLLLISIFLLFGYGLLTLYTGSLGEEDRSAMTFALMLSVGAPLQAVGLFSRYDASQTRSFLNRLTFFLALLSLLYTCESFFNLGLRSEEGSSIGESFGIQRVRGPLYGSSTGYFLLLPAFGWALYSFFSLRGKQFLAAFAAICLMTALLGLGSRAALILIAVYAVLLALLMKSLKNKVLTLFALALLCGTAGAFIYGRADTQRLQSMEDTLRSRTHETAFRILESEGLGGLILGQGYGEVWNWYRRDFLHTASIAQGNDLIQTPFGLSLYHCHSTFLESVVEFGLVGICWLFALFRCIWGLASAPVTESAWRFFTCALAVSLISLGFDLFFFKEARVSAIWWLYSMGAIVIWRRT